MNNDFPITLLPHNDKLTIDDKGRIKWIKAENKPKTYKACAAPAVKLQKIFTADKDIEELQEIQ